MAERALILLALAGALVPIAAADEAPTLFPGTTALVKGSPISCTTRGDDVRCTAGHLTATLSRAGKVGVLRSSSAAAGTHGKVVNLGLNGGFIVPNSAAYCHVYAAPAATMTCSLVRPKGGIPSTQGFDMSSRAVVVYRYDATSARHDVAHYAG
jgi:hypothetical protein